METFNKDQFYKYLSHKVADSTAKVYAADMAVSLKALEQIKLYADKDIEEILIDFVEHKKDVKNYLQEEFLTALTVIGSNDSGLYDSLLSKAKHYLAMLNETGQEDMGAENNSDSSLSATKIEERIKEV